jgi:hypothetical protein
LHYFSAVNQIHLERPVTPNDHVHDHYVQFYETEQFLCEAVSRYMHDAMGNGAPVVLIATSSHREAIRERLTSAGHDFGLACREGEVFCLDAQDALDTFMINEMPDEVLFQRQMGGLLEQVLRGRRNQQIFAYGEMVDVLWQAGNAEAAHQLESFWNRLREEYNFVLLCGYAMSNFSDVNDADGLTEVCRAHSHVVPAETYTPQAPNETRAREIVMLQQRVRALETELARVKSGEPRLQRAPLHAR